MRWELKEKCRTYELRHALLALASVLVLVLVLPLLLPFARCLS